MSDYQRACKVLTAPDDMPPEKEWRAFHVSDVYNPGNTLTGLITRQSTRWYGALLITHVNNRECPQVVFGTLKLHYPLDKHGRYHFPPARRIEVYDKLDGTNLFVYKYVDTQGLPYWTVKSRLTPVLQDSLTIKFRDLLAETGRLPAMIALSKRTGWGISYELWGAKNQHLMAYTKPIEVSLLFAVDAHGHAHPPSAMDHDLPVVARYPDVTGNYVQTYNWHRQTDEERIKPAVTGYTGSEGRVWYVLTNDLRWRLLKCKPSTIEAVHWATSEGISHNVIRATAVNVLETQDEITVEAVSTLLAEEFETHEILAAQTRIQHVINAVAVDTAFADNVLSVYDALGMSLAADRAGVMRVLSKTFEKQRMRHVYHVLRTHRLKAQ